MVTDTIATARLLLRRFEPADAPAMHAILADPEAMRFWSTASHERLEQTEAWVEQTVAAGLAGRSDEFAVLAGGRLVGKTGLWRDHEIGMIFAPSVWGQGVAREATSAVLARADARGLPRVVADADPRNLRVLRLLGALGFVETGRAEKTFCLDGVWADSVYLARDRSAGLPGSHEV